MLGACKFLMRRSALAGLVLPRLAAVSRKLGHSPSGATKTELDEVVRNGPQWRQSRDAISAISAKVAKEEIRFGIVLFPSMMDFRTHPASALFTTLESEFAQLQIPTCNILPAFEGEDAGRLRASLTDAHPNEQGYIIAAHAVVEFVSALLPASDRVGAINDR